MNKAIPHDSLKVVQHGIQLDPAMSGKGSALIQAAKFLEALPANEVWLADLQIRHQFAQGLCELSARVIPTVIAVRQIAAHAQAALG